MSLPAWDGRAWVFPPDFAGLPLQYPERRTLAGKVVRWARREIVSTDWSQFGPCLINTVRVEDRHGRVVHIDHALLKQYVAEGRSAEQIALVGVNFPAAERAALRGSA